MEVENQTPLLSNNNVEKPLAPNGFGVAGDESLRACKVCNCHAGAGRLTTALSKRQASNDSGISSLDPISERSEVYSQDEGKRSSEAEKYQDRVIPIGCRLCSEPAMETNGSCRQQETVFMGNGLYSPRSASFIGQNICSHPCGLHYGSRTRKTSETKSTSSDEVFQKNMCARSDQFVFKQPHLYETCGGEAERADCKSSVQAKTKGFCAYRRRAMAIFGILVISLGAATSVGICFLWRGSEIQKLEDKVQLLQETVAKMGEAPASLSVIKSAQSNSRPHVHLVLKAEDRIPVTRWKQRVLQWTPFVGERAGLKYDAGKRCLIVEEPGIYFVYNQIYVFRHVSESVKRMRTLSNHTMFHAIYNKPFNFPSDQKPLIVTESALSNCWNEDADKQIHTSYQGIIVKLQHNDQLIVALEDYNESIDTLDPKSTFFGAFKL